METHEACDSKDVKVDAAGPDGLEVSVNVSWQHTISTRYA